MSIADFNRSNDRSEHHSAANRAGARFAIINAQNALPDQWLARSPVILCVLALDSGLSSESQQQEEEQKQRARVWRDKQRRHK